MSGEQAVLGGDLQALEAELTCVKADDDTEIHVGAGFQAFPKPCQDFPFALVCIFSSKSQTSPHPLLFSGFLL